MKKSVLLVGLFFVLFTIGCGSSDVANDTTDDEENNDQEEETVEASTYATFGEAFSQNVPAGLKNVEIDSNIAKELADTCVDTFTECPSITESGGADSSAGEILSKLWAIDYHDDCTDEMLENGECFTCPDCSEGDYSNYIMPTVLEDAASCKTISTTEARYLNFGIDPCFFDGVIVQIDNMDDCATVEGGAVDISTAVPWYTTWEIPQTVEFSGYTKKTEGGILWTINSGEAGDNQYFLSLDSDWLYGGIKDTANNEFFFFGTGSPAYYESMEQGNGINLSAYAGPITSDEQVFEVIQVRDQPPNTYIIRMKSNGTHLWFQKWDSGDFPATPEDVDAVKDTPTAGNTRCVEIGESISTSKYVPLADCVDSFGSESIEDLNLDSNYKLKIIDGQTTGSIDFETSLTSATETSCATETETAE